MKNLSVIYGALFLSLGVSCSTNPENATKLINQEEIIKHVKVLSDDSFQGRAPATIGEQKTVDYLIDQYKEIGLEPAFNGSYIQDVPVTGQKVNRDSKVDFYQGKRKIPAKYYNDFMVWPADQSTDVDLKNVPIVYVGYGIQAPEEDWNDYKNVDVKGKIIIIKNNDPSELPGKFGEKTRLYYGRYDYKYEIGDKLGAIGVLIVHTTETAGYPWSVVADSWGNERFELASNTHKKSRLNGWISQSLAKQLFKTEGLDLEKSLASAEDPNFKPVEFKKVKLNTEVKAQYRNLNLKNTGGLIKGGKNTTGEAIVMSAHHDHLGIGTPIRNDSIFNGAIDNASGTAALLMMARVFNSVKSDLKRDFLILHVGGEEQGLLGSKYYASHPSIEPGKISMNVNFDVISVFGRTKDAVYIPLGRTTIDKFLLKRANEFNRIIVPDQAPEQGFFYRSDHFPFAKIGIPAFYLGEGELFIDKPEGYLEKVQKLNRERYHAVFDEYDATWDLSGAVEDLKLIFLTTLDIAQSPERMEWVAGDEFEQARKSSN